ncbi:amidohydrolase [soil metagenome]
MTSPPLNLQASVDEIMPGVIADRRHLHMHPELGFQEHQTAQFIVDRLKTLGVENIRTGIGKTGVTGLIRGTAKGRGDKTVMLRADMDALPMQEVNDVEYRSRNDGVMHACGHDSHVSMQLGTARMLMANRDRFAGTVMVLFQPAEEGGGGAEAMIKDGVLDEISIDATFGIHIWQHTDVGILEARPGVAMVGAQGFEIVIHGKGGHGAKPQSCVDPVVVGATLVNAMQTLISREKAPMIPGVVTVGSFQAGNAANVIPDTAVLTGTTRTVNEEQRVDVENRLREMCMSIGNAMEARVEVKLEVGAPPTINDPVMTELVKSAAREVVGDERTRDGDLRVVSEDYSLFLQQIPGCYYFVGSRNEKRGLTWGHHHTRFDIDEEAMGIGIETMTRTVLKYFDSVAG